MLLLSACTKLNVGIESEYTDTNFPTTQDGFIALTGPAYTQLSTMYAVEYWRMQELSTDAAIIPARDGNYDDGGQYRQLHKHSWLPDHTNVQSVWGWGYGGINTCNRILSVFKGAADSPLKQTSVAEMRAMRALFHFFMMDLYGHIPVVDTFGSPALPRQSKRADVFAFIEKELKAVLPSLNTARGAGTYGRPTKWMAFALLEKMYLNAEVYTGQARYTDAIAMADSILLNGPYKLDDDYNSIFAPNNGSAVLETIFAVPYDANLIPGDMFSRFGLHTALQVKYNLPFRPSIAMSTIPSYYAKFNLPGDVRNNTWLAGRQYNNDGSPITIPTTNRGLDATYNGPDPNGVLNWQLEFSDTLTLRKAETMDVGNDELGKAWGVRSIKYYPDPNANPSTRYQNNDVPVFRLADVMLMKAEAILRNGGRAADAAVLVTRIRKRAKAPEISTVTLDDILDERARELAWEGWRRNDLIRYGLFEAAWGFKTDADINRRIYPIPANEKILNPNLTQNPGY